MTLLIAALCMYIFSCVHIKRHISKGQDDLLFSFFLEISSTQSGRTEAIQISDDRLRNQPNSGIAHGKQSALKRVWEKAGRNMPLTEQSQLIALNGAIGKTGR